jgi:hypothetical protein
MGITYPPVTMRDMNVVFVEPFLPASQRQFARALAEAGATVTGIGEYVVESFDDQLKGWLYHYERACCWSPAPGSRSLTAAAGRRGPGSWARTAT